MQPSQRSGPQHPTLAPLSFPGQFLRPPPLGFSSAQTGRTPQRPVSSPRWTHPPIACWVTPSTTQGEGLAFPLQGDATGAGGLFTPRVRRVATPSSCPSPLPQSPPPPRDPTPTGTSASGGRSHLGHAADVGLHLPQLGRLQVQQPEEGGGQAADLVGHAGQGLRAQRHRLLQRLPLVARLEGDTQPVGRAHPARPPLPSIFTLESHGSKDAFFCFPNASNFLRMHGHPPGSGAQVFQHRGFTVVPPWDAAISAGAGAECPAQPPATLGDSRPCHRLAMRGTAGRATGRAGSQCSEHFTFPLQLRSGGCSPLGAAPGSGWSPRGPWDVGSAKQVGTPHGQDALPSKRGQNEPFPSYVTPKAPAHPPLRARQGGGGGKLTAAELRAGAVHAGTQLASALPGGTFETPGPAQVGLVSLLPSQGFSRDTKPPEDSPFIPES